MKSEPREECSCHAYCWDECICGAWEDLNPYALRAENEKLISLLEKIDGAYCAGDDVPYIEEIRNILSSKEKK